MSTQKRELVTLLLEQLPEDKRESVSQAMVTWWINIRENGGLRLTDHGFIIFSTLLDFESWTVAIPNKTVTKRLILDMDHKLQWPYYINFKKQQIVFFSSREATMALLYGNIAKWLQNQN
jgi:hypothetical protein